MNWSNTSTWLQTLRLGEHDPEPIATHGRPENSERNMKSISRKVCEPDKVAFPPGLDHTEGKN